MITEGILKELNLNLSIPTLLIMGHGYIRTDMVIT